MEGSADDPAPRRPAVAAAADEESAVGVVGPVRVGGRRDRDGPPSSPTSAEGADVAAGSGDDGGDGKKPTSKGRPLLLCLSLSLMLMLMVTVAKGGGSRHNPGGRLLTKGDSAGIAGANYGGDDPEYGSRSVEADRPGPADATEDRRDLQNRPSPKGGWSDHRFPSQCGGPCDGSPNKRPIMRPIAKPNNKPIKKPDKKPIKKPGNDKKSKKPGNDKKSKKPESAKKPDKKSKKPDKKKPDKKSKKPDKKPKKPNNKKSRAGLKRRRPHAVGAAPAVGGDGGDGDGE